MSKTQLSPPIIPDHHQKHEPMSLIISPTNNMKEANIPPTRHSPVDREGTRMIISHHNVNGNKVLIQTDWIWRRIPIIRSTPLTQKTPKTFTENIFSWNTVPKIINWIYLPLPQHVGCPYHTTQVWYQAFGEFVNEIWLFPPQYIGRVIARRTVSVWINAETDCSQQDINSLKFNTK